MMDDRPTHAAPEPPINGLSGIQTLVLAGSAGLSVANIYYAQPLLDVMAQDFGMSSAAAGLVVTLTQVGYGLGLIFILPMGDLIDRRLLIVGQGVLSAMALVAVATAGTETTLLIAMATMGFLAVLVQVIVAQASALATDAQRGKVVGTVTSGVVVGILAARFIAGVVTDLGGWRAVYIASAILTLVMVSLIMRVLPRQPLQKNSDTYLSALLSMPGTFLGKPILLFRGMLALLIFASFGTFWTALVLPLSSEPFSYSHTRIGLFGMVGVAGAVAAAYAGKLADRGLSHWTTGVSLLLLLASWGLIALLPFSVPLLLLGVLLLDLAVQAVHVTSLAIVVALHPQKSGRLIGGYMVFYSAGSAIGAIASTSVHAHFGWLGVSALGAAFSAGALGLWAAVMLSAESDRKYCLFCRARPRF